MSRPPKEINAAQVRKLSEIGATSNEIAEFFEVDRATIHRRFAAEIAKGRAQLVPDGR